MSTAFSAEEDTATAAVSRQRLLSLTMAKVEAAASASARLENVPRCLLVLPSVSSRVLSAAVSTPARAEVAAASVAMPVSPVRGLVNTKRTEVVVGTLCS